ncbi:MAG: hypothetical protein H5U00_10630 [Clostridia bacterium]|nr:hypothetical protein [Clostridia bacterium]
MLIAALNRLCNELGIDSIEVGSAIAVAVEAGLLPFGDFEAARELIFAIRRNTLLGRVLDQGAAVAGRPENGTRL